LDTCNHPIFTKQVVQLLMLPFTALLAVDKSSRQPVYLQISGKLMELIREGSLQAGHQLISTRQLAELLNVHRKTVVRAYDELLAQGWLESHTGSGTFVARHLPETKPKKLSQKTERLADTAQKAGFSFTPAPHLERELPQYNYTFHLDDGFPDARLAPLNDLSRAYRTQLLTGNTYQRLGYGDPRGSSLLREALSAYLNESRALKTTPENILIVRGTMMGLYLTSAGLLRPGDHVGVGESSYAGANTNFIHAGATLVRIPVDEYGISTDELDQICRKQTIRLVYVTSHHHHPTTVALRADRRMQLLRLSEKYGFILFEDDYDYDYHYENKPHLPLASADQAGMVLYCGSFTKTISPAFRIGYLVGSEDIIRHLAELRRIVDRQGDTMLENAMAELLQTGIIQRHLRKTLRLYRERRDVFCHLMNKELQDYVQFQEPEGGMAVWTRFAPGINLPALAQKAMKEDLYFSNGLIHGASPKISNGTRLGFASSTAPELERCVEILADLLKK